MTCYGIIRGMNLQQEIYETASRDAAHRARQLRKLGYRVSVGAMGAQATSIGRVKLSLLTIHNPDEKIPPPEKVVRI